MLDHLIKPWIFFQLTLPSTQGHTVVRERLLFLNGRKVVPDPDNRLMQTRTPLRTHILGLLQAPILGLTLWNLQARIIGDHHRLQIIYFLVRIILDRLEPCTQPFPIQSHQ